MSDADARHVSAHGAREAVKAHYRSPVFYTHYVGVLASTTAGERHVFCERCGGMTRLPAERCRACGADVVDVFRLQSGRTQVVT